MEIDVEFPGGQKVQTTIKGHTILTDQPPKYGGDGSGPSPFHLFLASIATCSGYFALAYLQNHELQTEGLKVKAIHEVDEKTHHVNSITIHVTTPKDFPKKHAKILKKAIGYCSVKQHLENPPKIDVKIDGE